MYPSTKIIHRLTAAQIAQGLKRLNEADLNPLKQELAAAGKKRTTDRFVDEAQKWVLRQKLDPANLSREQLERVVAFELASVQQALGSHQLRSNAESVDLSAVRTEFGALARSLLQKLDAVDGVPGRLNYDGTVRIDRDGANQLLQIFRDLGPTATDAEVKDVARHQWRSFNSTTLKNFRKRYPDLPSAYDSKKARTRQRYAKEAGDLESVAQKIGWKNHDALAAQMRLLGYRGYTKYRVVYLRSRVGDQVERTRPAATVEQHSQDVKELRRLAKAHPEAGADELAELMKRSRTYVRSLAAENNIAFAGKGPQARVLDGNDPNLRRELLSRARAANPTVPFEEFVAGLRADPSFEESFGEPTTQAVTLYFEHHLRKEISNWKIFRRQKLTQLVVSAIRAAPLGQPLPETLKDIADRFGSAPDAKKLYDRLGPQWRAHPDLYPEAKALLREGHMDWTGRGEAGVTVGWDHGKQFGRAKVESSQNNLRKATQAAQLAASVRRAGVEDRIESILEKTPDATVKEIADALGLRPAQVTKPARAVRARRQDLSQTRFSSSDDILISRVVQNAEPGDTLDKIQNRLMEDDGFRARHHSLSRATIRRTIAERVPEAADWKVYNLVNTARVLDEAAMANPDITALSALVRLIQKEHPGFPNYVTLLSTTVKSFKTHLDRMPFLEKYLGPDDKFHFVGPPKPKAVLSRPLAEKLAKAFETAPSTQTNDEIYAELMSRKDVQALTPLLDESTLTMLRNRFPGVIPLRQLRVEREQARNDAEQLSHQISALQASGRRVVLEDIAQSWNVDPQYFKRLMKSWPELFAMYDKRYEVTRGMAQTIGYIVGTLPYGAIESDAVRAVRESGLLPADMKISATTVRNATRRYPDLIPTVKQHNEELFEEIVARELFKAPRGSSLRSIFVSLQSRYERGSLSQGRIREQALPRWQKWVDEGTAPDFIQALVQDGKVVAAGQGRDPADFPARDNTHIERVLSLLAKIPGRLPLLEKIVAHKSHNAFAKFNIVNVQHLLGSNYRFIEAQHRMGANRKDIITVGIPYSASPIVTATLRGEGYEVMVPPLNIAAWERLVEDAVFQAIEKSKDNGKEIVVFDDGGLVSKVLYEKDWARPYRKLFRIVEQTTRGITVASQYELENPIIAYAEASAKVDIESPMIAANVADMLVRRLTGIGMDELGGKEVTLMGYGNIGKALAMVLAEQGVHVRIFDTDAETRKAARADAAAGNLPFTVLATEEAALRNASVVIGNSGHTSIGVKAIELAADGAVFGSSSSKLVEIDMGAVDRMATWGGKLHREIVDETTHPATARYTFENGKTITILADGFPLNFDGEVDGIEPEDIQITRGGMLMAGLMAVRGHLPNGIIPFDPALQRELIDWWNQVHG